MIVDAGLDVLTEELALDRAHGLVGKTAIHPSQVALINSWQAVSHEEYVDALAVLANEGASASDYSNKMNESGPHRSWARQVTHRAAVAGVLAPTVTWIDILTTHSAAGSDLTPVGAPLSGLDLNA
ncbi:MAG: HpcH/HpaI aldolase/citrate lyase family protein [Candidatus Nanopelagicales bacterium]